MGTSGFVNRVAELESLERWWRQPGASLAVVWGRKRVGKTWLLDRFGKQRRAVRHICRTRPHALELAALSEKAASVISPKRRSLADRPFGSWDDAFEVFAEAAENEPLLLVLDEFTELLHLEPRFPEELRALWDRLIEGSTNLKLVLVGSTVRAMEAIQTETGALYGRMSLRLLVHPFRPHEAALMLPNLSPAERAAAWGVCGGTPRYLALWDDSASFQENLERLVCNEHGLLLTEGDLVLSDETIAGQRQHRLPEQVLRAVAGGRTAYRAVQEAVSGLPTRTLDYLADVRLVERVVPVTEDPARTRLTYYRVADNFLAFWLGSIEPRREQIERGLGRTILKVVLAEFSDFMGARYEMAFRDHLRLRAAAGDFGDDVVAVGEWWRSQVGAAQDPCQLDAVVLAGRKAAPVAVGEAKWAVSANGSSEAARMARKLIDGGLTDPAQAQLVVCARERVTRSTGLVVVTAADIFP